MRIMGIEYEVKFNINSREIISKILKDRYINSFGKITNISMRSKYYDTKELNLLKNKFSLRIREENEDKIATLKENSFNKIDSGIFLRNEWNYTIKDNKFSIDIFKEKRIILKNIINLDKLIIVLRTNFIRRKVDIEFNNSKIELSLDYGYIISKGSRSLISELEVELKYGKKQDIFKFINLYLKKYKLKLEKKSKFERGVTLFLKSNTLKPNKKG